MKFTQNNKSYEKPILFCDIVEVKYYSLSFKIFYIDGKKEEYFHGSIFKENAYVLENIKKPKIIEQKDSSFFFHLLKHKNIYNYCGEKL